MNEQQVLHSPFDIETHKKTFINYLEVVILENGTVVYAVPSHQEKLIALSCEKLGMTRDELNDHCPQEYYFDFMTWLIGICAAVPVWNEMIQGEPNDKQRETLSLLQAEGLYRGAL